MELQAGGEQHQGKFLWLRRTVGFGGEEEAASFPTEGQGGNPGEATANHLQEKELSNEITIKHRNHFIFYCFSKDRFI